ncbi:MAG: hypothetical protein Q8M76_14140, partial [Spirochaetaceae bacterium]|nr:hypothetical protein [Spirochaetaceae bacterium]
PSELSGIVFVEGEDAVSTNMASESTLNYGVSGDRALQLARSGKHPGYAPYYAEYVLRIEEAGLYELWYGGTPPGPADELAISLASPLGLSVDGSPAAVYRREDVAVVEEYAPSYHWVHAGTIPLEAGTRVLRFEIGEKRRADDRFFFYLDAFFLAQPGAASAVALGDSRPEVFPSDPSDRSADRPFRSIEDCEAAIQAESSSIALYLELSAVHSILGDYLEALKALSRAAALAPANSRVRLLIAKNRIWRADIKGGLEAYRAYLALGAADRRSYDEAGKVAAWNGRYAESKEFYRLGLASFPGDISFTVNLGLAQLWSSEAREAEKSFAEAERIGLADPGSARRLASIFRANGYHDRAIVVYEKALAAFPDDLEL